VRRSDAQAITAADFTFETSLAAGASTTASTVGPFIAESGINAASASAYGYHLGTFGTATSSSAPSNAVFSAPSGNGSTRAFSSNHWVSGDYYQFNVSTVGLANVIVSFDEVSSATGPTAFSFVYSPDGVTFSTFTTYVVNNSSSFSTGVSNSGFNHLFDLSSVTALAGDATAVFLLVNNSSPTSSAGTDRIDNFIVETPEPGTLALSAFGASLALLRRHRRKTV
jgi:hypothetical protein